MTDLSKDRGFLLGDGVFDTLVAFNGMPVEGERHLARLVGQAGEIGIPVDAQEIRADWQQSLAGKDFCILRTTITRGTSERGLWPAQVSAPTRVLSVAPWTPSLLQGPVSLVTGTIRRNEQSLTSRLKSTSYLDNILAAREAKERCVDDVLLLNTNGAVACTTIANVFAFAGSRLVTPPLSDGVLAGTMRAVTIELAVELGLVVEERSLAPADLAAADLVFLTNSVRFLRPVSSLDGKNWSGALPDAFVALRHAIAEHVAETTFFKPSWD